MNRNQYNWYNTFYRTVFKSDGELYDEENPYSPYDLSFDEWEHTCGLTNEDYWGLQPLCADNATAVLI